METHDFLTAGDFAKIIASLKRCAAAADDTTASDNHKGLHVSLTRSTVTFSALRYGQTTEVVYVTGAMASSYFEDRHFLLNYDELESLYVILAYDANAPVRFEVGRQPQTHAECLQVQVADWYTGFMGSKREPRNPLRTKPTRSRTASAVDLETTHNHLTPLCDLARFKHSQGPGRGGRETVISVLQPLPALLSVKSYLY